VFIKGALLKGNMESKKEKNDRLNNKEKKFKTSNDKANEENIGHMNIDDINYIEKEKHDNGELLDSFKVIDHLSKHCKIETEKQLQIEDIVNGKHDNKKGTEQKVNEGLKELQISSPYSEHIDYKFPPIDFLTKATQNVATTNTTANLRNSAKKLTETLKSFGVDAKVIQVSRGPSITRFELQPSVGVKVSKIVNLADDIALNLAASGVRIEAPIPGKAAIGIEIANDEIMPVLLREVIESDEFKRYPSKLAFSIGKDITGKPVVADIAKMPHLLIAGATGSGKSVCINSLITSILYKANPNEVKLVMIDPKVVELGVYNGVPHLLIPVVTDPKKAASALNWAVQEMVRRYKLFADNNVRDLAGYNTMACESKDDCDGDDNKMLPQIIIIIDELADLMMASPGDVENAICRLAQMARAAGMHLVIATQRPSVDVITGVIKANIPSRISFSVSSQVDSRTILDMAGAEKLLGRGDMLFFPVGAAKPVRLQGAYISDKEVENIVRYIKENTGASYNEDIIEHLESSNEVEEFEPGDNDELLPKAIEIVVESGQASISMLQRRLRLGYARAARMIDQMEARGIIGGYEGSKPRQILITKDQYHEMLLSSNE
jgi:S-DNA-T family DNA segregation ATPase FtsK/SpoIIIE